MKRTRRNQVDDAGGGFDLLTRDVLVKICLLLPLRERFILARITKKVSGVLKNSLIWKDIHGCLYGPMQREDYFAAISFDQRKATAKGKPKSSHIKLFKDPVSMRCVAAYPNCQNYGLVGEKARGNVHCFDSKSKKVVATFKVQNGEKKTSVNALAVSKDGSRIFAGVSSPTKRVHCFDFDSQTELCQFPKHVDSIFAIAATESVLCSGGGQTDKMLIVSDLETQAELFRYQHKGSVRGLSASVSLLLSGSLDGYIRLFDLRTQQLEHSLKMPATVHGVSFCKFDERKVFSSTGRSDNSVYRITDFSEKQLVSKHKNGVSSLCGISAYSIFSGDYDGNVYRNVYRNGATSEELISKSKAGEIHALASLDVGKVFHAASHGVVVHDF